MSQVDRILPFRQPMNEVELETARARATERLFAMSEPPARTPGSDVGVIDAGDRHGAEPRAASTPAVIEVLPPAGDGDGPEPIALPGPAPQPSPTDAVPAGDVMPASLADVPVQAGSLPPRVIVAAPAAPRPTPPARRPRAARVMRTAYCPYCALELDPVPTADARCERCRRWIVVREIDGRIVHLTEAAVTVFEAERARAANIERWTAERHRWLEYARLNGAPLSRIERMERTPAESPDAVEKARALFDATVDRAVEEALRHDRWEVAALLRRDQAQAIRRMDGEGAPPTDEMLRRCRQAAELELRGIASMARTAVVVGARCCEACRADDGAVLRIAGELRGTRLPHVDCPKGLCGCRWDLAPRDVLLVQHYLQRTGQWPEMKGQVPNRPASGQPLAR